MPYRNRKYKDKKNKRKWIKSKTTTTLSTESIVDDCPICCVEMNEPKNNIRMDHCCKRTFHGECLRSWANEQTSMCREGTCPMCRYEWPVEFTEKLFEGYEEEELTRVHHGCSCDGETDMSLLAPNILRGLSEEQKSSLLELIAQVEQEYFIYMGIANPMQRRLLIVFMMCREDPLEIDPRESSADCQYEVMKVLLMWALKQLKEWEFTISHSSFAFFPRPSNYDYFGPEPYLAELGEL